MDIVEKAIFENERENHSRWLEKVNAHRRFVMTVNGAAVPIDGTDDNDKMFEEEEKERERQERERQREEGEVEKKRDEELEEEEREAEMSSMISQKDEVWSSHLPLQDIILEPLQGSGRAARAVDKFIAAEERNRERSASVNTVNKNTDLRRQVIVNTTDYDLKREKVRRHYAKMNGMEPYLANNNDGKCKVLNLSPLDYYDFMSIMEVVHDKPELLQSMIGRVQAVEPVALWTDSKKMPVIVKTKFEFYPTVKLAIKMQKNGVKKMTASVHAYPTTTKVMAQGNPESCLAVFLTVAGHLLQREDTRSLGCKIWKLGCSALRDLYPRQLPIFDNFVSPTKFERIKDHRGSIDEGGVDKLSAKQLLEHQNLRHTDVSYHPLHIFTLKSAGRPEVDTKFLNKKELLEIQEGTASPELPDKLGEKKKGLVNKIKKGVFSLIADTWKDDEPPANPSPVAPSAPALDETTTIRLVERRTDIMNKPKSMIEIAENVGKDAGLENTTPKAQPLDPLAEAAATALALGPLSKGGAMMGIGLELV